MRGIALSMAVVGVGLASTLAAGPVKGETVRYAGWTNCFRLGNGNIELVATTDVGPRVIRFGFAGGENLFREFQGDAGTTGGEHWKPYGGHRLWHAPEDKSRTYQPDNDKVPFSYEGGVLRLRPTPEKATGIAKEIDIGMSDTDDAVSITHRLVNRGSWEIETAAWALAMMAQRGRAVFPQEPFVPFPDQLLPARPLVLWSYTDMSDPRFTFGAKFIQLRQDPGRPSPGRRSGSATRAAGAPTCATTKCS